MKILINPSDVRKTFDKRVKVAKKANDIINKQKTKQVKKYIRQYDVDVEQYYIQEALVNQICRELNIEISKLNIMGAKLLKGPVDIIDLVKHRLYSQNTINNEYNIEAKTSGALNPNLLDIRFKPFIEEKKKESESKFHAWGDIDN